MNILVVTWLYAPLSTPRATRWLGISEALAAIGHNVTVVTSRCGSAPVIIEKKNLTVVRVGSRLVGPGLSRLRAVQQSPSSSISSVFGRLACLVNDTVWRRIYWPDKACLWRFSAIRHVRSLLSQHTWDGLITVSLPFTAHLVGHAVREACRARRWIVDVGDPFAIQSGAPPNNYRLYGDKNLRWELRILRAADAVAVTNTGMRRYYANMIGSCDKIHVIPPCAYMPAAASDPNAETGVQPDAVRLLFPGTLYRQIRNPRFLIRLCRAAMKQHAVKCELHFVGDLNDCRPDIEAEAREVTFIHTRASMSRAELIPTMRHADVLVNIGNSTEYQLPSKLAEFLCLGKKVLNVTTRVDDCSAEFLKDYPAALTLQQTGGDPTEDQVLRFVAFLKNVTDPPPSVVAATRERFDPHTIAQAYASLLL